MPNVEINFHPTTRDDQTIKVGGSLPHTAWITTEETSEETPGADFKVTTFITLDQAIEIRDQLTAIIDARKDPTP